MTDREKLIIIARYLHEATKLSILGEPFRRSCTTLLNVFIRDELLESPSGWDYVDPANPIPSMTGTDWGSICKEEDWNRVKLTACSGVVEDRIRAMCWALLQLRQIVKPDVE